MIQLDADLLKADFPDAEEKCELTESVTLKMSLKLQTSLSIWISRNHCFLE